MSRPRARGGRAWRYGLAGLVLAAGVVIGAAGSPAPSSAADASSTLFGEGGSFAEPMINALQSDAEPSIAPLVPAYFNADVDQGLDDFAAGSDDYSVTEVPLSSKQVATAAANGRSFAYVPFAASAIAIGAVLLCSNDNTLKAGTICPSLRLTVPQLAQVFTSAVDTWTDPTFAQAQGGSPITPINASTSISAIHEVEPTALNLGLETLFMNNTAAKPIWEAFLKLNKVTPDTPTELWPTGTGTNGDLAVADVLVPVNEVTNIPQENPTLWGQGAIAPLPVDWLGAPRDIPTVAVLNAAGAYVSPTVASMTAAEQHSTMDASTHLVTFGFSSADTAAYPIPAMSYLVVPTSGLSAAKATALAAFIRFVLGPKGQADVEALGAAPPTPSMMAAGEDVANTVAGEVSTTSTTAAGTTATTSPATASDTGSTSDQATFAGDDTGPTLAATGGVPWTLVESGVALVVVGSFGRRWARRRPAVRGLGK